MCGLQNRSTSRWRQAPLVTGMAGAALRASLALALVLLFCGWAILLGGLSGLTHACNDINNTNTTYMQ